MRRLLVIASLLLAACASTPKVPEPQQLATHAHPLSGDPRDYDDLLAATDGASLVLLGEATHGTHEFYVERAKLTQRLVREKGFTAVALEADWADAARVDRFIRGAGADRTAEEALGSFERFPNWMWRNAEFADLVRALRAYNDSLPAGAIKVRVFGLDLYGMTDSLDAVVAHLERVDAAMARDARTRYACFNAHRNDPEGYGRDAAVRKPHSCMNAAQTELVAIRNRIAKVPVSDKETLDELFYAEQNARVVMNAEEYWREEPIRRESTWNLRDRHMVLTMDAIQKYLMRRNGHDHIVVWAHNSHVGDARATERAQFGEWNMGELVRRHWPRGESFTVGFSTDTGTLIAADNWGEAGKQKTLNPAIRGSHGRILHDVGLPAYYLVLKEIEQRGLLRKPREQRGVGVIYRPYTELESHYFKATLVQQFDAVVHIDRTTAVRPLE